MDTLEEYVTKYFSDVPNNGLPADDFTDFKGANSFDTLDFRRIYKIKPIKDFCQVFVIREYFFRKREKDTDF